jgi:hypothetical protein
LQQTRAEFEINLILDIRAALDGGLKSPALSKALEQGIVTADVDPTRPIQYGLCRKSLAQKPCPDRHIHRDHPVSAVADAGGDHPGQELRIPLDIRDQIEELRRREAEMTALGMICHDPPELRSQSPDSGGQDGRIAGTGSAPAGASISHERAFLSRSGTERHGEPAVAILQHHEAGLQGAHQQGDADHHQPRPQHQVFRKKLVSPQLRRR